MGKYKWKCNDSQKGGNTWRAANANSCPTCGSEDIEIIAGPPPIWPWILALLSVLIIALLWLNRCSILPSMCDSDDNSYSLVITKHDNYFEISTEPLVGLEKTNFYVVDQLTGKELYSEENKYYPCQSGDFVVRWDRNNDFNITGDSLVNNFKVKNAHQNACKSRLGKNDISISVNAYCEYSILLSNYNDNQVEVSINKNGNYKKGKVLWTEQEIGKATNFYIRLINNKESIVSKKINECKIPDEDDPENSGPCEITEQEIEDMKLDIRVSFELYMEDPKNNRSQFTSLVKKHKKITVKDIIDCDEVNGNELVNFTMYVRSKNDTDFRLTSSGIEVDGCKIINGVKFLNIVKLNIERK